MLPAAVLSLVFRAEIWRPLKTRKSQGIKC